MKIAVASGKGGTGKTMIATSLAASLSQTHDLQFIDCDVEAPNAHLYLKPQITQSHSSVIQVPVIDEHKCSACGICVNVCQFHALARIQEKILVFPQLCHSCGSCKNNCPDDAIFEKPRKIGILNEGVILDNDSFFAGELTISEPMPTPIIRQLKALGSEDGRVVILDSPPGASCAVLATIYDADFVLLITEPTPFGLHDLKQMLGILEKTGSPSGIIINRDGIGDESVEKFINQTPYPLLLKIPYDKKIAVGLAEGKILCDFKPGYKSIFLALYNQISVIVNKKIGAKCQ